MESEKKREERLAKQREYYKKRKMKAKQKAYYEANRERILAQQRDHWAKKQEERRLSKTFWGRVRLKLRKLFN